VQRSNRCNEPVQVVRLATIASLAFKPTCIEAARELTRLLPSVPLLMFTNFETARLKLEALSAGVKTVVSKNGSIGALISGIQALLEPVS
jgi:DNA-binding NarL/FixJ family response regulator